MTSTPEDAIGPPGLGRGARLVSCFIILVAAIAAVFGRVAGFEFLLWDDPGNVTNNPHLQPATWESLAQFWTASYQRLYVPVAYTMFWMEANLHEFFPSLATAEGSFNPAVFHIGNLALHTLTVLTVFMILRFVVQHDWAAMVGALLFGLHPLQSESVGWITATRGLSSALLGLFAVWLFLQLSGVRNSASERRSSFGVVLAMALSTVLFVLSLLAKPTAVVFPLVLIVLMAGWKPDGLRRTWPWLLIWIVAGGICVVISKSLQPDAIIQSLTPLWTRPFVAFDALTFFLYKTILPWPLAIDYGRSPPVVLEGIWPYVAWIVPMALFGFLWRLPHRRFWLTAYGVYVVALLPMLGLVPFRFQDFSTVADRYVYVAMLGPALAAAWCVATYRSSAVIGGIAAILGLYALLSFVQIGYWRDTRTLLVHELKVNSKSFLAYSLLGKVEELEGNVNAAAENYAKAIEINPLEISARTNLAKLLQEGGYYEQAIEHYHLILTQSPELLPVKMNLAMALAGDGQRDEAQALYEEVLAADPDFILARMNYAELLRENDDLAAAVEQYRKVLEIEPDNIPALVNLGTVLGAQGDVDAAIEQYQAVLQLRPNDLSIVSNFAILLLQADRAAAAEEKFRHALELDPSSPGLQLQLGEALAAQGKDAEALQIFRSLYQLQPESLRVKLSLAWLLSTSNDDDIRNGEKAIQLATSACQATSFADAKALDTLAAAYAETGDFDQAIRRAESARRVASLDGNDELAVQINLRIRDYRKGTPYRSP